MLKTCRVHMSPNALGLWDVLLRNKEKEIMMLKSLLHCLNWLCISMYHFYVLVSENHNKCNRTNMKLSRVTATSKPNISSTSILWIFCFVFYSSSEWVLHFKQSFFKRNFPSKNTVVQHVAKGSLKPYVP